MAVTQLSDLVIVPELFSQNMVLTSLALDAFVQSGVAVEDSEINAFLNGSQGGSTFSPRWMGPLPDEDANISSDDPAAKSTPQKISGLKNTAVRQSLNKSWSSMDLAADLAGADPVAVINQQLAKYWLGVRTRRVLSSLKGVMASNVTNNGADMVIDITGGTGAAAIFNAEAFLDAKQTMGDMSSTLTAMAVHSMVYTTMQKLNLIDFIPDASGQTNIAVYQGVRVIVDDAMTVDAGKYYTYLFGSGAIALGYGTPKTPFEIKRDPEAGNGGGQDTVFSRMSWVIHPQGFVYNLDNTPTIVQLETAATWTRAFERKRVPLACLITKG